MLTGFENKVADFIKANALFCSSDRVLLAVSGGADSTALLYAMCALKAGNVLSAELLCAHINHQLRGAEADKDENFVVAEAEKLKLAVITRQVDVREFARNNKLSIETAARKLRLESLLDIAKADNCDCVVTAHQKNDNAETILQRLSRGTGVRGLGGIWPRRVFDDNISFVRPLLCVGRDEIIEYLKKRNLKWRDDHTNVDCSYRRNFIRHRLLPALRQQCSDSIVESLFDLSVSAQRFYNLVCSEAEKIWPKTAQVDDETVTLNLESFLTQSQPVKVELVRRALARLGSGERDLTHRHYEKILRLAEQEAGGRKLALPNGFIVQREYENLFFTRPEESYIVDESRNKTVELRIPGKTKFGCYLIEAAIPDAPITSYQSLRDQLPITSYKTTERFDLGKIKLPLVVRYRREGDRFWPLGLAGQKKVGKFLTAAKVPQQMRKNVLIIADSEKIIWLWPIRISERARITDDTKKVIQLQITECSAQGARNGYITRNCKKTLAK
jgi:tRNA(Ile)-lysidine synthase